MNIHALLARAAESPTAVSRRSGVSRATIKRIIDGDSAPTLRTLRELALAVGLDIDVSVGPASDPDAAVAARVMLEAAMREQPVRPSVAEWLTRFDRFGLRSPTDIVWEAGTLSSPVSSGVHFAPDPRFTQERLVTVAASAAASVRSRYVVSGAPAAAQLTGTPTLGATILWVSDADRVSEVLGETLHRADRFQPAGVVVASAPPELFIDSAVVGLVSYAAPIQVVIDLYGLGMDRVAADVSEGW